MNDHLMSCKILWYDSILSGTTMLVLSVWGFFELFSLHDIPCTLKMEAVMI